MAIKNEWLSPCGLYCGVCAIRMAHQDDNQKLKEKLAPLYGVSPEGIRCEGCLSDVVFAYCTSCAIKSCASQRGISGCHACGEFPCENINNFPVPVGKQVILRSIPQWRELGTESWVEAEEKRHQCPSCGSQLFRGAKRCRKCGTTVALDL